jgi:predicted O-methyltransferase YrrM
MLPKHIEEAIHHYIPHLEGWSEPERCCEMAERILETKAQVCVDIGVFAGRSTVAMGFAARELGTSRVYGIDTWNPGAAADNDDHKEGVEWWEKNSNLETIHQLAMRTIWDHRLEPWVTIIRAKSENVHQLFPMIDFLNIDGGHSELASCRDVELYLPKVRSGGYIFMDDTAWPTTQKAVSMIEEQCDLVNTVTSKTESRTYKKR